MDFSTVAFFVLLFGVISSFAFLLREVMTADRKAQAAGYGPATQLGGTPCMQGKLDCVSVKAPTLGRSLSFAYDFSLFTDGTNVTGSYNYRKLTASYSGVVYLIVNGNRVKGRSLMSGFKAIEGLISPKSVRLKRGFPKESFLSFLSGPYEFSIRDGRVRFDRTTRAGSISKDSELHIEDGRLTGRVLHGPQQTWGVDVDVTFERVREEVAVLAIVLACDDILATHHSD